MQEMIIYNLFPRLAGDMRAWDAHLDRAAEMGFDWVFINPIQYPGFSGSLYAVKDFYRLNPSFIPEGVSDPMGELGFGLLLEYPEARIYSLSEEHGCVDFSAGSKRPVVGERVTVVPNHVCPVSNLFDEIVGVRGGRVELIWPVACRGALQ